MAAYFWVLWDKFTFVMTDFNWDWMRITKEDCDLGILGYYSGSSYDNDTAFYYSIAYCCWTFSCSAFLM